MDNTETQPAALGDFDFHKIHVRDSQTKRLVKTNPVKLIIHEGVRYVEHPVGSGNLYWENREPAGRLEEGKILRGKAHVAYTRPLTDDEQLANDTAKTKQENARLMKEIAEIKAEKAKLVKAAAAVKPVAKVAPKSETKKG